jgi:hypothetical protein
MTILETIPIIEQTGKYIPFLMWGFILGIIFLYIGLCSDDFFEWFFIFMITLSIISFGIGIAGLIASIFEPAVDTGRVKYIVRLDNNYSINEFYDKYKVLEHTKYTDIYTVEEIND